MRKTKSAPAIVRKWKKFLFCGCSHGKLANTEALDAVVKFRQSYKPDKVIHAGDFIDTSAWRAGARGGPDESESVCDDILHGLSFLERLKPTLVFNGNHEIRLWKHAAKPNAIVAHAAAQTIYQLREFISGELHAEYVEDYVYEESWRKMGNYLLGHGFSHSTHAVKKHADEIGNTMFCHLHRIEVVRGTRLDRPVAICAGYLGDRDKFTYSDLWSSRFRWGNGWVYGEYCDNQVEWNLHHHTDQTNVPKQFQSV